MSEYEDDRELEWYDSLDGVPYPEPNSADDPWWSGARSDW